MQLGAIALAVAVVLASSPAAAKPAAPPQPAEPEADSERNFWDWLADPNANEIRAVLRAVDRILDHMPDNPRREPADVPLMAQVLDDARAMLRFGLRLEPGHPELWVRMAKVEQLAGNRDAAIAALRSHLANQPPERASKEVHLALARLLARAGNDRGAIRQYQHALQIEGRTYGTDALFGLATLYMSRGRAGEAVALLLSYDDEQNYFRRRDELLQFTLAVAYDQDGQVSRAHDILDRLTKSHNVVDLLVRRGQLAAGRLSFPAATDRHYFTALLYEVAGMLPEARAEWAHYAAAGPAARYAGRARQHIAGIDRLLDARATKPRRGAR